MIFPLFMWGLGLLVKQVVPAILAIFALRHCAFSRVIFMLVELDAFGGINRNPRVARLLLPCNCAAMRQLYFVSISKALSLETLNELQCL